MANLITEFKYAVRMVFRTPVLSIVSILTIALGVGLTTHTFSVVYGSGIRGLPFENAGRLGHLEENALADGIDRMAIPMHDYLDWREQQTGPDGGTRS